MLSLSDINQLQEKGISKEQLEEQLEYFRKGFPFMNLTGYASDEKGIKKLFGQEEYFINSWSDYLEQDKEIVKFVPASGAASRMFKDLFAFLDADYTTPQTSFEKTFFSNITKFAFFRALNQCCVINEGKDVKELIETGNYKLIVENLLKEKGLNYGKLPKGLILFHSYENDVLTAMEEHLIESAMSLSSNKPRNINLHFTVSPEHLFLFEKLVEEKMPNYSKKFKGGFTINFSVQKSSTDTIAVDLENNPFREDNQLVFRPGGHGALIENLNNLSADVVFIKNIDNVTTYPYQPINIWYKKVLGGILIDYQRRIFNYLELIDSGKYSHSQLLEMLLFLQGELHIKNPETKMLEDVELVLYIKSKLNRPLRVCGMVKNTGEPGGGPFFVRNADGVISLQIVESSQIDLNNPEMKSIFDQGTHFNPVDLVCGLKDYKGQKFDLRNYVDKNAGFISYKSKNGKDLKALELPGLWNGAMSDWNTIFVEVAVETFNPVKTVNDLLKKEHQ